MDARLARFQAVIHMHAEVGFGCVVDLTALEAICRGNPVLNLIGTAYEVAYIGIIGATIRRQREKQCADKIDFVFDEGPEFERSRAAYMDLIRADPDVSPLFAGSPRSATDHEVLPMQAAKWLVWQLRFRFTGTIAERGLAADEDKLFIAPAGNGAVAKADALPIAVHVWDAERFTELRTGHARGLLAEIETTDFSGEFKERLARRLRPWAG